MSVCVFSRLFHVSALFCHSMYFRVCVKAREAGYSKCPICFLFLSGRFLFLSFFMTVFFFDSSGSCPLVDLAKWSTIFLLMDKQLKNSELFLNFIFKYGVHILIIFQKKTATYQAMQVWGFEGFFKEMLVKLFETHSIINTFQ